MSHSPEFGQFLRDKREQAGWSVRKLAQHLGVSHVYLGQVERAKIAPLDRGYWPALLEVLSSVGVDEDALERQLAKVRPLQLDIADSSPEYQDLALALARRIRDENIDDDDMKDLLRLLGDGRE